MPCALLIPLFLPLLPAAPSPEQFTGMTSFNTQHAAAAKAAAQELVKLARDRGSMDDITVVVTLYDWD
eukprot:XP_001698883.1 predicted protein [Chlamydomonas reinhardtii]